MKSSFTLPFFCLLLFFGYTAEVLGQCNPPNISCKALTTIVLDEMSTPVVVEPEDIVVSQYTPDPCWEFRIEYATPIFPINPPSTLTVDGSNIGTDTVVVYIYENNDFVGLACWGQLKVQECDPGTPIVCNSVVHISIGPQTPTNTIDASALLEGGYCTDTWNYLIDVEPFDGIFEPTYTFDSSHIGSPLDYQVASFQGTSTTPTDVCSGQLEVTAPTPSCLGLTGIGWTLHLPKDFQTGDPAADSPTVVWASGLVDTNYQFNFGYNDVPIDLDTVPGPEYTERTWTIINWCSQNASLPASQLPRLDTNSDGTEGDAYAAVKNGDSLFVSQTAVASGLGVQFKYVQRLYGTPPNNCMSALDIHCQPAVTVYTLPGQPVGIVEPNHVLDTTFGNPCPDWFPWMYEPSFGSFNDLVLGVGTYQVSLMSLVSSNPVTFLDTCVTMVTVIEDTTCMPALDIHCQPAVTVQTMPNAPLVNINSTSLIDTTYGLPCQGWHPFILLSSGSLNTSSLYPIGVHDVAVVSWDTPGSGPVLDTCYTTLTVIEDPNCIPGTPLQCKDLVTVELNSNGSVSRFWTTVVEGLYCQTGWSYKVDLEPYDGILSNWVTLDTSHIGDTLEFEVFSFEGSNQTPTSSCTGHITIDPTFIPCSFVDDIPWHFNVPKDFHPGDPMLDSLKVSWIPNIDINQFFDFHYLDTPVDLDCVPGPEYIERKWTMIAWCHHSSIYPFNHLPRLDANGDGTAGDAYNGVTIGDGVYLASQPSTFLCSKLGGLYDYVQRIYLTSYDSHQVNGKVFHDGNESCDFDNGETPLANWTVVATSQPSGEVLTTETDALGNYTFDLYICDTSVSIALDLPYNYGGAACPTTYELTFLPGTSDTLTQDIGAQLDDECPLMVVDMASPKIRPCFDGYYSVSFANVSTDLIEGTYIDVQLDDDLTFSSSPQPNTDLGNGQFRFEVGDLQPGEAGQFPIHFFTDCDATPGATHCSEVHIYPDTLCPDSPLWFGANIEVEGFCENDSVFFTIKNTGAGPSQTLDFVVVEDFIMYMQGNFSLPSNATLDLDPIPADGSTYRLEAEQEPGHPYGGMPAIAVEGCAGFTQGMVLQFPIGNANPFIEMVCQENVSSFDPNEKAASPKGYGNEHLIEPSTRLDYIIHFQNTGTDTAYRVVVLDTLSLFLDASALQVLSGSHPYRFERLGGNVLRFTFDGINLPDSTTNYLGSQGFVKFQIPQMPGNPIGSVIENSAAIYFDYNDPIFTNTTFHRVDTNFIEVVSDVSDLPVGFGELLAYPNPSAGDVIFEIPTERAVSATFHLFDPVARQVFQENFTENKCRFQRNGLAAGVYFYRVEMEGGGVFSGRVILK
ncbi:MAG: T9SS type A sorting domain-containing protein [Saprospiraceae bacterium]